VSGLGEEQLCEMKRVAFFGRGEKEFTRIAFHSRREPRRTVVSLNDADWESNYCFALGKALNGLRKYFQLDNLVAMKMLAVEEEQFLTDARGKRTGVLLNLAAYERLRQAEEDLAELQAYDSLKGRAHSEIAAGQSATLASYRRDRKRKVK
jgi:hypothetical protein